MKKLAQDLNSLKYNELQKLAKRVGIRANQKIEKLIKALSDHYLESESLTKKESDTEDTDRGTAKNETGLRSLLSNSHVISSQLFKAQDEGLETPKHNGGRKRRRTFDLDEPSFHENTPTIIADSTPERVFKKQRRSTFDKSFSALPKSGQSQFQDGGRKRRQTFELNEALLQGNMPTADDHSVRQTRPSNSCELGPENENAQQPSKRQCRNALSNDKSPKSTSSPSTKAIIDAMDANLTSSERRRRLLSALTKKVQTTITSASSPKSSQPSLIPRFTTFVVNRKKESQKPLTPGNKDWNKIHKKEFSKFDSIDVYLEKKKQRKDQLSNSTKKSLPFGSPALKTKPVVVKPVNKNPGSAKIFQPQVTSVKKIDFNFNKTASCNKKTPARPSGIPGKGVSPASVSKASAQANVHIKVTGATPFKFTGNTGSAKKTAPSKTAFDLKASLARPLTWKPHTGKLQPLDFNKEQTAQTQRLNMKGPSSHRILASKTRSAKVKNEQRTKVVDRRTNQKYMDMMKKRGLLV